jgi:uncharacterized membrane protein required for colicin V production
MNWVDIVAIIIIILSFVGGLGEGAVRTFSSLIALIISIPLAGLSYKIVASWLSFMPGTDWGNFIGFFIAMGVINVIFFIIFFVPRKIISAIWNKGVLFRVLGGGLNVLGAMIGLAVFTLVIRTYPVVDWLVGDVNNSNVLQAMVTGFGFVKSMLPDLFLKASTVV